MLKNFSLDRLMYGVVLAIALCSTISTAITTVAVALGVIFIIYNYFRNKEIPQFDAELLKILAIYFAAQFVIALTSLDVLFSSSQ